MLPKPPSLPPLSAQFQSSLTPHIPSLSPAQPPQPPSAPAGAQPPSAPSVPTAPSAPATPAPPSSQAWGFCRSSGGQTRIDQGNRSLISDPQAGHTISLDHVKQEAQIIPTTPAPSMPAAPSGGLPTMTPPKAPLSVQDLGTRTIAGHAVQGKMYTFAMPQKPNLPGMPKAPGMPQVPGMPPAPAMPQTQTVEVWHSPQLQMPLASRVTSSMGTQTTMPQHVTPGEPSPTQFQIPPGYKIVPPPSLSPPSIPKPSIPKPSVPTPSVPAAPKVPSI